jgi:hypothetical protein
MVFDLAMVEKEILNGAAGSWIALWRTRSRAQVKLKPVSFGSDEEPPARQVRKFIGSAAT